VFRDRRLTLGFAALLVGAVLLVVITEVFSDEPFVQRYGSNLAAEAFGILVTLVLVERILTWQRERAVAPIKQAAAARVGHAMTSLVHLMQTMEKAAAPPDASAPIATPEGVVDRWVTSVERLNFVVPAVLVPVAGYPSTNFLDLCSSQVKDVQERGEALLDRYAEYLGTEVVTSLEGLFTDSIWLLLRGGERFLETLKLLGREPTLFLYLYSPGQSDELMSFGRKVKHAVRATTDVGGKVMLDEALWGPQHLPEPGAARFEGDLATITHEQSMWRREPPDP
jgi:hypothetical protein